MERNKRKKERGSFSFISFVFVCFVVFPSLFSPLKASQQININTATAQQLESLPGVGPALAKRIIEHREKHGPFKRPEDVIIVRGMSAKRFRQISHLIQVKNGQD